MFKVGDRVKIVRVNKSIKPKYVHIGDAGEIYGVDDRDDELPYLVKTDVRRDDDDEGLWWMAGADLELLPEPAFKVGDRVRVVSVPDSIGDGWVEVGSTGSVIKIHPNWTEGLPYCVKMGEPGGRGEKWWFNAADLELIPAVPEGWTPASEPPNDDRGKESYRNTRVILNTGREWYGWYNSDEGGGWYLFDDDADASEIIDGESLDYHRAAPGEVIAWREIAELERDTYRCRCNVVATSKPAARYCVAADLPTTITVWHDTRAEAEAEAMRLYLTTGKAFRVLRVVFEIKPGEPVVTKWEE